MTPKYKDNLIWRSLLDNKRRVVVTRFGTLCPSQKRVPRQVGDQAHYPGPTGLGTRRHQSCTGISPRRRVPTGRSGVVVALPSVTLSFVRTRTTPDLRGGYIRGVPFRSSKQNNAVRQVHELCHGRVSSTGHIQTTYSLGG